MAKCDLNEFEFEFIIDDNFKNVISDIVKIELSKLIDSGEYTIKNKPRVKINKQQSDNIKRVRDYWNEIAVKENTKLFHNSKLNIISAIEQYGIDKVFEAIDIIWKSPLMKGNNVYKKHIQSLDWCMKPESISKIFDGIYSKDKSGFQNNNFKIEQEEWD